MKKFLKFLLIVALNVSILLGFSNVLLPSSFSKSTGSLTLKAQGGCGFVDLAWDKVEGAVGFYIYRGTSEGNESSMPLTDFPIAENNFKDTKDLKKGTKYCYYVAALNKDNTEIARSNEACATPTCSSGEEETCEKSLKFQIGNKYYWVNDEQKGPMESVPQIKWDRTFLLIRYVSEEVNANISWDGVNRIVTIVTPDGTKLEFKIGNNKYKVNGVEKPIDPNNSKVVPFIDGGRTFIPLRVTGDNLGAKDIIWHGDTKIAELIFKVPCPQKPKGGITAIVQCPNLVALTPISGVTINIYSYPGHSLVWSGVTDTNGKIDTGFTLPPGQYEVVPSGGSDFMCTKVLHIATVVSGQKTDIKIDCCKIETKTICACLVRMTIQPDANGNYQVYIKENCKGGDPIYDNVLNFPATLLDSNLGINVLTYYNQLGGAPIQAGSGCIEVKFNPSNNSVIQWWAYPNRKPCCSCCVEPPSGMVAWWPLDETSGTTAHDIAGYPNNGTCVNCPTPVSGKVGSALYFIQNHYIEVPPQTELDFGTGDFSIDAWVKAVQCREGVLSPIIDRLYTSTNTGYSLYLDQHPAGTAFLKLNINGSIFTSTSSFQANVWNHVAVTIDRPSSGTAVGTFYINGVPSGTFTPPNGTVTNNLPLWIGEIRVPGGRCETTLDEIELFNRVLSP
ncbi:stalk domain-containing protein, partial [Caldisericum exile]|uniref:stalk domain-containing protein n=1 Tax=Caldisericum exile TaxID=693075 RepID=UPI003C789155